MTDYNALSPAQFADLLSQKLGSFRAHDGKLSARMFYFDGQDPFEFAEPSSAIASLHRGLPAVAQRHLELALLDLLGSRGDTLLDEALKQLAMAVGNLRRRELLAPLVRRIGASAADRAAPRELYVMAISVLKGFGHQSTVFEATRELIEFRQFPPDLLIDAFEIQSIDETTPWQQSFLNLRNRLEVDHIADRERVRSRLECTAAWLVQRLPQSRVGEGLTALALVDRAELSGRGLAERRDVTATLIEALLAADSKLSIPMPEPDMASTFGLELEFLEVA